MDHLLSIAIGVFVVLHGLVHLLYFGQSRRLFELRPGMIWPDDSWAFSKLLGEQGIRWLASVPLLLAAIGFVAGGIGLLINSGWWPTVLAVSAALSSLITILFWDGKMKKLDDQGFIGLLINLVILAALNLSR
jgi:hypothetical protein